MDTYTLAFATRLKRRIFNAGGIRNETETMFRDILKQKNIDVISMEFSDYGIVITAKGFASEEDAAKTAKELRIRTSKPLRYQYYELGKMPSLWTENVFIKNSRADNNEISAYYDKIKTR
ncbi:MAG: hypothetical protein IKI37_05140 [Oscillospiraceae bacterium]|nr:hypothetical protein [Oscillospiraceae bacterium]